MRRHTIDAGFCLVDVSETEKGVCGIAFGNGGPGASTSHTPLGLKMKKYFDGKKVDFSGVKLDLAGASEFQRKVWEEARRIPYGETRTYAWIARRLKTSPRAVGQALKKNPAPVIIPCHRVVSSTGVGGFFAGVELKVKLLELEGAL